jgi:hypothetical protein
MFSKSADDRKHQSCNPLRMVNEISSAGSAFRELMGGAGVQPAVSPISNRQGRGTHGAFEHHEARGFVTRYT